MPKRYLVEWFGPRWGSPLHATNPEVKVPAGEPCNRCGKLITEGESGVVTGKAKAVWHRECFDKQYKEDTQRRDEAARADASNKLQEQKNKTQS